MGDDCTQSRKDQQRDWRAEAPPRTTTIILWHKKTAERGYVRLFV